MITVDSINLTSSDIAALAHREASVRLADEGRSRAERSFAHAVRISAERTVYGRSTGVGANRGDQFDVLTPETADRDLTADIAAAARLLPSLADVPRG